MATSAGYVNVNMTFNSTAFQRYDDFIYGTVNKGKAFVPADPPPIITEDLKGIEQYLIAARPDFPHPFLLGDHLNSLVLPRDWDPNAHLGYDGEWSNRTCFWNEGKLGEYKRLPLAPRVPR